MGTNIPEKIAVDPASFFDPDFVRFCEWQDGRVRVDESEAPLEWLAEKSVQRPLSVLCYGFDVLSRGARV